MHGTLSVISKKIKLSRDYVFRRRQKLTRRQDTVKSLRKKVADFLTRHDNSYELPGKKDQVRGRGVYALCDTMRNLHLKFVRENPHIPMSVSTFCKARPYHIKLTRYTQRKMCLCQKPTNMSLQAEASQVLPRSTSALMEMKDEEIREKLESIPKETIKYHRWEKHVILSKGEKKSKIRLTEKNVTKEEFIDEIMKELPSVRQHSERVAIQYEEIRSLKKNMQPQKEATVQLDYSENWQAKFMYEISSAYYDKCQVTVHPMVLHCRDEEGELQVRSYVGISEVTNHSLPTTFAFLKKLIPIVKKDYPHLEVIHFVSDGPSSQYRNKSVCNLIARFHQIFSLRATWSWWEAGHGKGPCDGVGGAIKKKADNIVKTNKIISNANDFHDNIEASGTCMFLIKVDRKDVDQAREEVCSWNAPIVKGLSSMHTVVPMCGKLYMKTTSCFRCCYRGLGNFTSSCSGWQETCLNIILNDDHTNGDGSNNIPQGTDDDDGDDDDGDDDDDDDEDDIPIVNFISQHNRKQPDRSSEDNSMDEDEDDIPLTKLKFQLNQIL